MTQIEQKVSVSDVKIGMYVSRLDRPWLETRYLFQGFHISSSRDIEELHQHCEYVFFEVTESAMMSDPHAAQHTLSALHEMGIMLSIDDFGTGYSSLAYLRNLPVGELKIDKSFVLHMAEDQQDRKIVQSIIDLAHNLEMSVVAEGIENQQTLDMLIDMGCDRGQGFYIGRPMPIADMPSWVEGGNWCKSGAIDSNY